MEELELESPLGDAVESDADAAIPEGDDVESDADAETGEPVESIATDDLLAGVETPSAVSSEGSQLRALLEAIVYITEEPLSLAQIATALNQPRERVQMLLDELVAEYDKPEHGIAMREVAGGYKMTTKPEHHETVRNFVRSLKPPLKLSLPALETLAVIAYKQPVTAPEIMEIRGVQGAGVLKTLLDRKLIAAAGRKNVIGKPILYKTTKDFLVQFGAMDGDGLPGQQGGYDLDGFFQPGDPRAGRLERDPHLLVFAGEPARAQAELKPPFRDPVDCCRLVRDQRRVPVVVAEHHGPHPQPAGVRRPRRRGSQRGELRPERAGGEVVANQYRVSPRL